MAKLYFDKSVVSQHEGLEKGLSDLVESGMAKVEKQGSFRSLYDIHITGVTVYYEKRWHYDSVSEKEAQGC